MTTIQIRIDEETKKSAAKIFSDVGLDITTGIKMYLKQVTLYKGIPFRILTENGLTPQQEREILQAEAEALRGINVTKAMNLEESKAYLESLKRKSHAHKISKKVRKKVR